MSRKPKRTESLSIRIDPDLKAQLAIAANYLGTSIASVVGWSLEREMSRLEIPLEDIASSRRVDAVEVFSQAYLTDIYKAAAHTDPLIMQLRLFHIFPKGLSEKERVICETITACERFLGGDLIFEPEEASDGEAPTFNLEAVQAELSMIESFAEYRLHERQRPDAFKIDYESYRELKLKADKHLK